MAIVTGGGSGLGEASAKLMAAQGARVTVADINRGNAEKVAAEIVQADGEAVAATFNLHEPESIGAMVKDAAAHWDGVDILFANAADLAPDIGMRDIDVATMEIEVWDRIFRANVRGTMLCIKETLPFMKQRGAGAIVITGSALALRGNAAQVGYSSAKAALMQLSRSVATTHGPSNIRCNVVLPGLTLTDFVKKSVAPPFLDMVRDETLLPRLTEASDVANAVAFLASDAAAAITGQALVVDGGESIHFPGIGKMREVVAAGHLMPD
ncbi:hypothetical protein NSU_3492 [Novosphingobium pentaromativorans US6-1]|uniref:Short-chain dehydrogenase/reductase SDR n=1 Tax=Novosphingobium pentaromativorans US6-1 TaxID=1088721 RepID=G6EGF8_9SPHN|nr:hypothetical protein NSU_3492 [Novosphingobium pentaromativorans US6-1]